MKKTVFKRALSFAMAFMTSLAIALPMTTNVAHATFTAGASPINTLVASVADGNYLCITTGKNYQFQTNRYKLEDGGYTSYYKLINPDAYASVDIAGSGTSDIFVASEFEKLKQSQKKKFLSDFFTLVNAVTYDGDKGKLTCDLAVMPTTDTGIEVMQMVSQQTGMATTMLSTILSNTTPDYLSANRIYEPFSGVIGTILGLLAILIMALLGVSMGLDLAYITIPAVNMALGGGEGNGQGGTSKVSGLVSTEAKKACQAAEGGSGGQGGSGDYKAATGIYFKYRWKGLVMLAVCLLYLVQGEIYSLIGWFLDLFGGFLGQ